MTTTGTIHVRIEELVSTREFASFVVHFHEMEVFSKVLDAYKSILGLRRTPYEIRLSSDLDGFNLEIRVAGQDEFVMWRNANRIREMIIKSGLIKGLNVIVSDDTD